MKKVLHLVGCVILVSALAACQAESVARASGKIRAPQKVIAGFSFPESVLIEGSDVYVANIGAKLEPMTQDGDGFISKLNLQGELQELKYFPKTGTLHAPKGMAVIGSILYVADINRVVGFDRATRETVFELTVPGTSFLNDCTAKDDHTLLVSCTDSNRIVSVDVKAKTVKDLSVQGALNGPNGLTFDATNRALYVVGMGSNNQPNGELGSINEQGTYTALCPHKGLLDGLVLLDDGSILFSDWMAFGPKGVMYRLDAKTKSLSTLPLPLLAGPADFDYDANTHQLWIPEMLANQVSVYSLDK